MTLLTTGGVLGSVSAQLYFNTFPLRGCSPPSLSLPELDHLPNNMPVAPQTQFSLGIGQPVRAYSGDWYRVVKRLGDGMSATGYLVLKTEGRDRGTFFALKLLRESLDETRLDAFQREIETLESLTHAAIMRIDDNGAYTALGLRYPFYICRYYHETLQHRLQNGLDMAQRFAFTSQLLSALAYLEGRSIIHCDIKPANIFVSGFDCVLADFGFARLTRDSAGRPLGPSLHHYRTPDIALSYRDGGRLTPKSDVFQLGLVVVELFTGVNPCRTAESGQDDVVLDPIPPLDIPLGDRISSLISKMLEFDPYRRFTASFLINIWQGIYFEHLGLSDEASQH